MRVCLSQSCRCWLRRGFRKRSIALAVTSLPSGGREESESEESIEEEKEDKDKPSSRLRLEIVERRMDDD